MATQQSQPLSPFAEAAPAYAEIGYYVLPLWHVTRGPEGGLMCACPEGPNCTRGAGKHPRISGWQHNASRDPEQIARWVRQFPRANIGILTGHASGFVALDPDSANGKRGEESLARLLAEAGEELPVTPQARTGSGGRHILFAHPGPDHIIGNRQPLAGYPDLDVRGDGGFIVAAPSLHMSGREYAWVVTEVDLAPWPAWLAEAHARTPRDLEAPRPADSVERPRADARRGEDTPEAKAEHWVNWYVRQNGTTGSRNDGGKLLALQLRDTARLSQGEAEGYMIRYARAVDTDPKDRYSEREALATLASIYSRPARDEAVGRTPLRSAAPARIGPPDAPAQPAPALGNNGGDDVTQGEPGGEAGEARKRYPHTELGNADRLLAAHGERIRYTKGFGFVIWDGRRWKPQAELEVRARAKSVVRGLLREAGDLAREAAAAEDGEAAAKEAADLMKWALQSQRDKMITAMVSLIRDAVRMDESQFDAHPYLFNAANGTIDLRTGQLRPHDPRDYLMQCSPVAYDPDAAAPVFGRFLGQIMCGREALAGYLQRALGYCLTGDVSEQVWHLLVGEGENGKSTLIEAISHVLGDYGTLMEPESITISATARDGSAPSPDIAKLKGRRFVKVTETEEGARLAPARIKRLTGGDELQGRFLRHDLFEFLPTFKIWIYTNHKPRANETTHAFWRRVRLVPFDFSLKDAPEDAKDKELPAKLRAEAAGILAWLVQGCMEWQRIGLRPPAEVAAATEAYQSESDAIGSFLAERTVTGEGYKVTVDTMYNAYKTWCDDAGESRPVSKRRLGQILSERGIDKARGIAANGGWGWRGIALRADGEA
jgi:putative DNA primase/helicase